jgi:hypothetical protein
MLTGEFECSEVAQILAVNPPATKDVHDIVYKGGCVALTRRRDVSDTLQFRPLPRHGVEHPGVVVVIATIGTSEPMTRSA